MTAYTFTRADLFYLLSEIDRLRELDEIVPVSEEEIAEIEAACQPTNVPPTMNVKPEWFRELFNEWRASLGLSPEVLP